MPDVDVTLLSFGEIEDLILAHRQHIRHLDTRIASLTTPGHTILSVHGVKLLQQFREQTALRLGALLEEKNRRERERYAKRKKRSTVTSCLDATTGCA